MAAGPWLPTNTTPKKMLDGTFDWAHDAWKVALFLSSSNLGAASTTYAGVTGQHANANGYLTGGIAVTFAFVEATSPPSVKVQFVTDPEWIASGGNLVARRAGIYKVGGDVAFYCLLDSTDIDVTTTPGNTLTIDNDGTPYPVFTHASIAP